MKLKNKHFNKMVFLPFLIVFSIAIGTLGWYTIYQRFFTDQGEVYQNWKVDIGKPTQSTIIIDELGGLGLDGELYKQYKYDSESIKRLEKKPYWIKVTNNNIKIVNQKVTDFTDLFIENDIHAKKNKRTLLRHPINLNTNCYYYIKQNKKKPDEYAIFVLNPIEKKLYLFENYL
ncbi:hypothetical protein [Gottfriedia solisilvae]|uniref:hypothetical protein n=1 Tax=Gottfriedia solisilvae TaxID=1516104 RepID=UPI0011531390|nr:hypothetical protein [Gottfriedia solisilvae]